MVYLCVINTLKSSRRARRGRASGSPSRPGYGRLIQESEKPERNLVTATELNTINSQEAVLDILHLIETLFGTAHLEQIAVIYKEIML